MTELDTIKNKEYNSLLNSIGELLETARTQIAVTVNNIMVQTYWQIGKYIVEYEQNGKERAEYGKKLLQNLSQDLTLRYGSGFNRSNLQYMRKMYLTFPICTTLSCKLSWSHYQEILKADDELEISFYVKECENSNWGVRELRRQMKSMLFHRLALSKDKEQVLALAKEGQQIQNPQDILKDPYVWSLQELKRKKTMLKMIWKTHLCRIFKIFCLNLAKVSLLLVGSIRCRLAVEFLRLIWFSIIIF